MDNNANSINSTVYNKAMGEDRLINLIDKLQIEGVKTAGDGQEASTTNHIGAAAVAPVLLLANHISPPATSSPKVANGDAKAVSYTFLKALYSLKKFSSFRSPT